MWSQADRLAEGELRLRKQQRELTSAMAAVAAAQPELEMTRQEKLLDRRAGREALNVMRTAAEGQPGPLPQRRVAAEG